MRPLGPVSVKGLTEPLEVYELIGAGTTRTRLQAMAARGLTRFVGRDRELDQVHQALDRARAGSAGWAERPTTLLADLGSIAVFPVSWTALEVGDCHDHDLVLSEPIDHLIREALDQRAPRSGVGVDRSADVGLLLDARCGRGDRIKQLGTETEALRLVPAPQ